MGKKHKANNPTIGNLEQKSKDRDILQKTKEKSDANFEKSITYISAGALALSMTFIEKIIPIKETAHLWLLFTSWGLLAMTLLINLLSQYLSSYFHEKTTEEFDTNCEKINENIDFRNKIMRGINIGTVSSLFLGISCLILFLALNLQSMKNENDKPLITKPDSTAIEERGATITKPASTNKPNQGTSENSSQQDNSKTNNSKSNGKDN